MLRWGERYCIHQKTSKAACSLCSSAGLPKKAKATLKAFRFETVKLPAMCDPNRNRKRRLFEKKTPNGTLKCILEQCEDGSVYVCGDEFEMMIEFAADALRQAIDNLAGLGYREVSKG